MSNFEKVINHYLSKSYSEADKGNRFERLMQAMLRTIPPYCNELQQVWLWSEFPYRQSISLHDTGIDLVAQTNDGNYWAIQCKCYRATTKIDKGDTDTFLTSSARAFTDGNGKLHYFSFRLWIDTTEGGFTSTAAESFKGQMIPASVLHLNELAEMPIDWEELDKGISGTKAITQHKKVLPHQQEAIDNALSYFSDHDRGKLLNETDEAKRVSNQFYHHLSQHFREHRDVGFYADLACLSTKYFSDVVKLETGESAAHWIHTRVVTEAKMLLHTRRDLSIQAIAGLLGFADQATFSRYFRREAGQSPTDFREAQEQLQEK